MNTYKKTAQAITLIAMVIVAIRLATAPFFSNVEWLSNTFHILDCICLFNIFILLSAFLKQQQVKKVPFVIVAFIQLIAFLVPKLNELIPVQYVVILLMVIMFIAFFEVIIEFYIGLVLRNTLYSRSIRQMGNALLVYAILNLLTLISEITFMSLVRNVLPDFAITMFSSLVEIYFLHFVYNYFKDNHPNQSIKKTEYMYREL